MNNLKVLIKLFDTNSKASDGSNIPKYACDEYLLSQDYQLIINDKLSLGGITHKDRRLDQGYVGLIGDDDQILVNDNVTHYISKIFFKEGDPVCYAFIEVFDPNLFSGKRRDNIINLRGMLESGVKPPVSVVIQALWSPANVAEKIIRIKGVDFTNNPAFEGAGTIKLMSNFESFRAEEVKSFSNGVESDNLNGCIVKTKVFSADVVLESSQSTKEPEVKLYTRKDIINIYGLNSPEALATKSMSSFITEEELKKIAEDYKDNLEADGSSLDIPVHPTFNNEWFKSEWLSGKKIPKDESTLAIDHLIKLALDMVGSENSDIIKVVFRDNKPKFVQMLKSVPNDEPKRDELLKRLLDESFRVIPATAHFSTVNSVRDRMLMDKFPRYALINRLINSYKFFYESRGERLTPSELNLLKVLMIQDINMLIKKVQEKIKVGSTLNSLFALTQFSPEIAASGIKLSKLYRQVIIAEETLGFIPAAKYKLWSTELKVFYDLLCNYTFGTPYSENVELLDKF